MHNEAQSAEACRVVGSARAVLCCVQRAAARATIVAILSGAATVDGDFQPLPDLESGSQELQRRNSQEPMPHVVGRLQGAPGAWSSPEANGNCGISRSEEHTSELQ